MVLIEAVPASYPCIPGQCTAVRSVYGQLTSSAQSEFKCSAELRTPALPPGQLSVHSLCLIERTPSHHLADLADSLADSFPPSLAIDVSPAAAFFPTDV